MRPVFALALAVPSLLFAIGSAAASGAPGAGPDQAAPTKYDEVRAFLRRTAAANPINAKVIMIGASGNGLPIEGLMIGNGPLRNLVVGTHHGNEYGSTEVAKATAAALAANPIEGQTVYVIPVLNVPGYNSGSRWEEGHDPNRDYPGPCGGEGPFKLKSTAALARFIEQNAIVSSATLHTFYPAVVYPWGLTSHDLLTPYDSFFKKLVELASVESGYQTGNSTEVIYPANGTYEDYAYWKHGIWSILFELGHSHYPSEKDVAETIRVNVPGIRRMLENSPVQRAADHAFHGRCDERLKVLDRHDE